MLRVIAIGLLLSAFSAYADVSYKDWTLSDLSLDPILQVPTCHAFTNVSTSDVPIGLSLTFPKNQSKAPMAFVKIDSSLKPTQVLIKASSRESEPAFSLNLDSDPASDSYWYVPMNMDRLISRIAAANVLEILIQVQGSESPIQISLAGSSKILQETKRCVGGELFSKDFFKDLNDKNAPSYPVEGSLDLERAVGFFQSAYVNYVGAAEVAKNLEGLRKENRGILREEAVALSEFNAANDKLLVAQKALDANDQERAGYQKSISDNQNLLGQLGPQKQNAEQNVAQKKSLYEPLRQQAKSYTARINSAQSNINSADSQIRSLKNQISNAQSEISSLQGEASNLESQVRRFESELSGAESDLRRAESDYRNYDVFRETRRILDNDFNYRNAQIQIRNEESNLRRAQDQVRQAQNDLRTCQSTPDRNCGAEQAAVTRAQNEVMQSQNRIRQHENTIRNAEWSAQNRAQREHDDLKRKMDATSSRVNELQSQIQRSRSRIRSIFDYEIPSRNSEIENARNEIPRQERILSSARRELSAAQSEYADFKARTDYDRIKAEYTQAEEALSQINKQIEKANEDIATAERRIRRLDQARPDLVKTVDRRKVVADEKKAKLDQVQGRMTDFKAKEAEFVKSLEFLLQQFDQNRGLYKTIISAFLGA